jgi:hypothetical protein
MRGNMASLMADNDDVRELNDITASILHKVVHIYTMQSCTPVNNKNSNNDSDNYDNKN